MNQLCELGVRQGIQLVTEALTNSAKQVRGMDNEEQWHDPRIQLEEWTHGARRGGKGPRLDGAQQRQ